jgi:hypothetical protein
MEPPGRSNSRPTALRAAALLAMLAASLLVLLGAASASAVIVLRPHGRTLSYQPVPGASATTSPFDSVFHNLDYNGGPVMPSNTNYAFYWDPSGAPAYPSDYQPGLKRFFEDLSHDSGGTENVDSVSAQYNDAAGHFASYSSHFGGAIIDTDPYPANGCEVAKICLAEHQIRAELVKYLKANSLPMDLTDEYFVLTPPAVESCFGNSNAYCSSGIEVHERELFCAFHGADQLEGGAGVIVYATDPYVAGGRCDDGNHPNGSTADATISGGLSHEHNESLTDPEPNNAWTDWASGSKTGYEVGDKCRTYTPETEFGPSLGTAPNGASYNQVINGHLYWYQQEWSNQGHACVQRLAFQGEEPKAAFTFTTGLEEAKFDASGSTAPGGVAYYEWQLNEHAGQTPIETTSPTFQWGNTKGVLRVALTVFAKDGTGNGTMHVVNIGQPTITKVTPVKGPVAGATTVVITGTNFNGGETVVKFGSLGAASFTVNSPTKITAISPPAGVAKTVDVTVTTHYGTSPISLADHFTFGPPTVTSVIPNGGPKAGGTSVIVKGEGFEPGRTGTTFRVGARLATSVSCSSSTQCTFVTPPAKEIGTVDVRATVNKLTSVKTLADQFTYS